MTESLGLAGHVLAPSARTGRELREGRKGRAGSSPLAGPQHGRPATWRPQLRSQSWRSFSTQHLPTQKHAARVNLCKPSAQVPFDLAYAVENLRIQGFAQVKRCRSPGMSSCQRNRVVSCDLLSDVCLTAGIPFPADKPRWTTA